ncbi:hypothetical protein SAMN05216252_124127 [Actinacidiphila glaucinigra]|uniref:Uncharacterized protein n=1 Tax=Actinacidiphila glaucinigra TaxID=235986 RepID=A0A239MHZ9_9ACTN|nr:hypothetical protein SAMN05216252_124127 [Actinacidiphila glaucinigra]
MGEGVDVGPVLGDAVGDGVAGSAVSGSRLLGAAPPGSADADGDEDEEPNATTAPAVNVASTTSPTIVAITTPVRESVRASTSPPGQKSAAGALIAPTRRTHYAERR